MNEQPLVTILMAVYNGEHYLQEQLDSILGQSHNNWRLWIRDDGSTDCTLKIIETYAGKYPGIFSVVHRGGHHGAVSNFSALFDLAAQDTQTTYLMFCDQDDVWLPDKVADSLRKIREVEASHPNAPVLVYGNLKMVAQDGQELNEQIALIPKLNFERAMVQNFAFGCTMMLNKQLVSTVKKIPLSALNHDYWVGLVTSALGYTAFLSEPLIRYRQHTTNVTSQGTGIKRRFMRFTTELDRQINTYQRQMITLEQFYDDFASRLNDQQRQSLGSLLSGYRSGRLQMIYQLFKNRICKLTFLQNIGMLYLIIFFYSRFRPTNSKN